MANLTCSLNVMIPSSVTIIWTHNSTSITNDKITQTGNTTTLLIENLQPSDAGVYQCVFNDGDVDGSGWILRRNIRLLIRGTCIIMLSSYNIKPVDLSISAHQNYNFHTYSMGIYVIDL